jgi:predicted enzyme related to lactoylglutathione lyase
MNNRVVHFEIHAADLERARNFYQEVFGWSFPLWMENPPYWGVMTAPEGSEEAGINGGLVSRMGEAPGDGAAVNGYVCTVQVENYDEIHDRIMNAGGTVAMPKMALVGMAWQGYYKDTEGNIFGVHQSDPDAR